MFCPHVAAEMWSAVSPNDTIVSDQPWPQVDADADIEFLLMIDGVSGGRPSVDRRFVEDLPLEALWKRATGNEHADMFRMLAEEGLKIKDRSFTTRKGVSV